jgi:putative ATP-binding cassette transporter
VTYLMLGVVGFILPQYLTAHGVLVFQLIPTLLFCMGPLAKIVAQSPLFIQADVGLRAIADIERQLDAGGAVSPAEARAMGGACRGFREIAYRGLTYTHGRNHDGAGFRVGPLDLVVHAGETLFLVGGNGSGKSTTLRLLTGLYPADDGVIEIDGRPLEERAVAGLREQFSAVFADFHLFDRLYGIEDADPAEVQRMILEMGLAHKVRFENGRFTQISLSTGQRKRLALIAALLEDRPIYVFDEWSAEQDVLFRKYFYTKILADLKAKGKTIIAVTHDERYWHVADRVVRLDLGAVLWERPGAAWREA